jgi:hypothetical protein
LGIGASGYLDIDLVIGLHAGFAHFNGAEMSEQSEALKERTMLFAISVLDLIDKLPDTPAGRVIAYQLGQMFNISRSKLSCLLQRSIAS